MTNDTKRFAILETKMHHVEEQIATHSKEDSRRFDKLEGLIERLTWRVGLIVGGITAIGAVAEFLMRGGH